MKGIVKVLALSHKNGKSILRSGDTVTENDVDNFEELAAKGFIEVAPAKEAKEDKKAPAKEAKEDKEVK